MFRWKGQFNMLRYTLVLGAELCLAAPVGAGSWADAMFEKLSQDFGSVPRGPTLSHPFRLTNNTGGPVHISSVRVSCGCVSASAEDTVLAPGQSTAIQAFVDTRRFLGSKGVTIYVSFDQPQRGRTSAPRARGGVAEDIQINPGGLRSHQLTG
jgi:hypothetical protein